MNALKRVQYKAGLIVTGCCQGTSRVKLYTELGWETLEERRKYHRLTSYYKIKNKLAPEYLQSLELTAYPENGTGRYKD